MPVNMKDYKERGTVLKGSNYYSKRFRHVSINIRTPQAVNHVDGLVTNKSVATSFLQLNRQVGFKETETVWSLQRVYVVIKTRSTELQRALTLLREKI
jgi:hypothetical protein